VLQDTGLSLILCHEVSVGKNISVLTIWKCLREYVWALAEMLTFFRFRVTQRRQKLSLLIAESAIVVRFGIKNSSTHLV
jgi:hypothetical protein